MKSDEKFFVVFCFSLVLLLSDLLGRQSTEILSLSELIQRNAYPHEMHEVFTQDGYILNLYRIPYGKNTKMANKRPILLMYGLMGHSEQFLINDHVNGSLAFFLADEGFDVWLGTVRGSISGEKHINMDSSMNTFWNFSNHEMGVYDLPAQIDYILRITEKDDLQYVGFSQGGRIFVIMTTMKPEYQHKVSLASLIAPSVYTTHFNSWWLRPIALRVNELMIISNIMNIRKFPPKIVLNMLTNFCSNILTRELCFRIYKLLLGDSGDEVTSTTILPIVKYSFHASVKQLYHFAQTISSGLFMFKQQYLYRDSELIYIHGNFKGSTTGHFRPWDYGKEGNLEAYGQKMPSDYAIENISVPIALYYSLGDSFSNYKDVEKLCDTVKKCVRKLLMKNERWTHTDYLISRNADKELNQPLSQFCEDFNTSLYLNEL